MDQQRLEQLLSGSLGPESGMTILTGAGISAESRIPTFRGPEGYWTVGSRVYQPQEMATFRMFQINPRAVWQWYLYRLGVCRQAEPNAGHYALVEMEQLFPERFTLVTQNVDNLHLRAGQQAEKTYEIHGNIFYVRCSNECERRIHPMPAPISGKARDEAVSDTEWRRLHCENCGHLLRPHVLWFDEAYNESCYRLESTMRAAANTDILIIVGTSGATNLPNQVVSEVYHHGGVIIDINIEPNAFSHLADGYQRGISIRQPSSIALPWLLEWFKCRCDR